MASNPQRLNELLPSEFLNKPVGGVADSLSRLTEDSQDVAARDYLKSWLKNECGILWNDGEKFADAVFRSVREAFNRKRKSDTAYELYQLSQNPGITDADYNASFERKVSEL